MASLKPGGNFESSNQASRSLLRVHIFHRRLRQHQCALAKGVIYFQKNWVNLSKMEDDWFSTSKVERLQILFVSLRICRRCKIPTVHWPLADIADLSNKACWQLELYHLPADMRPDVCQVWRRRIVLPQKIHMALRNMPLNWIYMRPKSYLASISWYFVHTMSMDPTRFGYKRFGNEIGWGVTAWTMKKIEELFALLGVFASMSSHHVS